MGNARASVTMLNGCGNHTDESSAERCVKRIVHSKGRNTSTQDGGDSSECSSGVIAQGARSTTDFQVVRSRSDPSPIRPGCFSEASPFVVDSDNIPLGIDQRQPRSYTITGFAFYRRVGIAVLAFFGMVLR